MTVLETIMLFVYVAMALGVAAAISFILLTRNKPKPPAKEEKPLRSVALVFDCPKDAIAFCCVIEPCQLVSYKEGTRSFQAYQVLLIETSQTKEELFTVAKDLFINVRIE